MMRLGNRSAGFGPRTALGVSLIELMVALVISTTVVLGLVTLVNAIGTTNRAQDGLARLQENGRFAVQRIAADLRAAASQHCSGFDSAASALAAGGTSYVDPPRTLRAYFDANDHDELGLGPTGLAQPYLISTRFFMVGHECTAAVCTPALNATNRGVNLLGAAIPDMGSAVGRRGMGADVLTIRYLAGDGARIEAQNGEEPGGADVEFVLDADADELARSGFADMTDGDPVWVSDCSSSELFVGNFDGADTVVMSGNVSDAQMRALDLRSDARAFHLPTALQTVSYYLQIAADPRVADRRISVLMRKAGDGPAQELVQGVERLDFLYGVEDIQGRTRFLTATEVDALGTASGDCPPFPRDILPAPAAGANESGCGWRAVKSVEVFLLANTVDDASSTADDPFRYSWKNDGNENADGEFEDPSGFTTLRNGLPPGRMLRREFRALVSLRGYNY